MILRKTFLSTLYLYVNELNIVEDSVLATSEKKLLDASRNVVRLLISSSFASYRL